MKFLILQETDWEERGPHQQHHLMERLSIMNHEVRVIDYEFLWSKKKKKLFSRKKSFYAKPKIIENSNILVKRPSMVNLPILCYLTIPFFHFISIFEQIRKFKPDYIIGFGIINCFIGLILSKTFHIPFYYYLIDHLHTLVPINFFQPIAKIIETLNIRYCDKLFAINQGLIDYSLQLKGNREKSVLIPGGVDLKRYKPNEEIRARMRKELGIKKNEKVIMFMGWFYDFSGLKEIVNYLLKNEELFFDIRCLFVGEGDLYDFFKENKKKMKNTQRIILTGKVPFHLIPNYLQASDFCLLPAYKNKIMENIVPIKLYEYIATGKPVIATKLHGIYKEFGNNHGIIYINKPEEVFKKIRLEENELSKIIENGQIFIQEYDWDSIIKKFLKMV